MEDPKWQRKFSAVWAAGVGLAIVLSLPRVVRAFRRGRLFTGFFGVRQGAGGGSYVPVGEIPSPSPPIERGKKRVEGWLRTIGSVLLWAPFGTGLDLAQCISRLNNLWEGFALNVL